jgi:hypothetical protein
VGQVDDLLKACQLHIASGEVDDVAGVAIDHVGFQLYPLAPDQQGLNFADLKVAAALVPNALMEGDTDEEGSDSDGAFS